MEGTAISEGVEDGVGAVTGLALRANGFGFGCRGFALV